MYASVDSAVNGSSLYRKATRWASGGSSLRFFSISGSPKKTKEMSLRSGTSRFSRPRNSSISSRVSSIWASSMRTTAFLPDS